MKTFKACLFIIVVLSSSALAAVHPGFDVMTIHPLDTNWRVSGVDQLSDGRLVIVEWGNPGSVYILDGVKGNNRSAITYNKFAWGFQEPLGLEVVEDTIYVMQKNELTKLVDSDNDGVADEYIVISNDFNFTDNTLEWSMGATYLNGYFYVPLSVSVNWNGSTREPQVLDRSSVLKIARDGSTTEIFASGFRSPNGIAVGFGKDLFMTDNQGFWLPQSKLNHIQAGKHYGFNSNPPRTYQSEPWTKPVVWLPHGGAETISPSQPLHLESGRFQGQLLVGESRNGVNNGIIHRVYLEEVNGLYQGGYIQFGNGYETGTFRLHSDGEFIYVGCLGGGTSWGLSSTSGGRLPRKGLQRLKENNSGLFEILAVRTMGSNSFEVEFTENPSGAGNANNYLVESYINIPEQAYGAGSRQNPLTHAVSNVAVSGNKATLTLPNLRENSVVTFTLSNITGPSGNLWRNKTWYTLNHFGPGTPVLPVEKKIAAKVSQLNWKIQKDLNGIQIQISEEKAYELSLYNLAGVKITSFKMDKPANFHVMNEQMSSGMHFLQLKTRGASAVKRIVIP